MTALQFSEYYLVTTIYLGLSRVTTKKALTMIVFSAFVVDVPTGLLCLEKYVCTTFEVVYYHAGGIFVILFYLYHFLGGIFAYRWYILYLCAK